MNISWCCDFVLQGCMNIPFFMLVCLYQLLSFPLWYWCHLPIFEVILFGLCHFIISNSIYNVVQISCGILEHFLHAAIKTIGMGVYVYLYPILISLHQIIDSLNLMMSVFYWQPSSCESRCLSSTFTAPSWSKQGCYSASNDGFIVFTDRSPSSGNVQLHNSW